MLFKKTSIIILATLFSAVFAFSVSAEEIAPATGDVVPAIPTDTPETAPVTTKEQPASIQPTESAPALANDTPIDPARDQILLELENLKASIDRNTPTERAYDSATAPGTVSLTILDKNGLPESFQTFVSFVAVGGKTYGGAVDKDGLLTTTLPSGRYYTDVLTTDPNQVAPPDLPGFFLEPEDTLTFGPFFLAEKTEPTEEEKQIQAKLEEPSGLASILNTIMHLLGEILKEVRK